MDLNLENLQNETHDRWQQATFLEGNHIAFTQESQYLNALAKNTPWVPYEEYMYAKLIQTQNGKVGLLHIRFPPKMAEDSRLHIHHHSDRVITVLEGSGYFLVAEENSKIKKYTLSPGQRLWMPRGVKHTFWAGNHGLVLESIHNPFIPFDDPRLLEYEENSGYLEFLSDGRFREQHRDFGRKLPLLVNEA